MEIKVEKKASGNLYTMEINGNRYAILETEGNPIALDEDFTFAMEAIHLLWTVNFVSEEEWECLTEDNPMEVGSVDLEDISSDGVRDYFKAVQMTLELEAE